VKLDVAIVGAGFAGAATAFHLLRSGFSGTVGVFEREELPGVHASGLNASLVRQSEENPAIRRMMVDSVAAYRELAQEVGFSQVGSYLIGTRADLELLRDPQLIPAEWVTAQEICSCIPLLEGHRFEVGLWTPGDGVMDIARLLQFYLEGVRAGGGTVRFEAKVKAIEKTSEGFRLQVGGENIAATVVVNAAGAWAGEVAKLAGAVPPSMTAFKRHLFILEDVGPLDPRRPFVWNVSDGFYFRPESGGLLFCICDEIPYEKDFIPTVEPDVYDRLVEKVTGRLPRLEKARVRKVWAGFRVKTPHGGFCIGPAEDVTGFFWVAGLGGHGMGASWAVGRVAAEGIVSAYFGGS